MFEKVKVSREVADAIDDRKRNFRYTFEDFMKVTTSQRKFSASADALNSLSVEKLANILLNGYEVEQTPEEIILERFNKFDDYDDAEREHKFTVCFVLDTLGIKIKGINE